MALDIDKKLYIAVAAAAVLGGAVFLQNKKQAAEARDYSAEGRSKDLPKIELTEDKLKTADKITVTTPPGDAGAGVEVVLEKKGEEWRLVKPVAALASQSNVKSVLDNLKTLKVTEEISQNKDSYEKLGVADGKATRVLVNKGGEVLADFYFGEGGSRGQMTRIAGRDGVYAVKGYSSYVYQRDVKGWRDLTVLKFDDVKAKRVELVNTNGSFVFEKKGEAWTGTFKEAKAGAASKKLDKLDEAKVKELLTAFKSLNADGFADGKSAADTGLDAPVGTLTIELESGEKHVIQLGKAAEGSSKWAKKGSDAEIFSLGSWSADWITAAASKFEKAADKKDDKKGDAPGAGDMPKLDLGSMGASPH